MKIKLVKKGTGKPTGKKVKLVKKFQGRTPNTYLAKK